MNDPRDFLAFARLGGLGVLVLGIGLLGALVHRKPARQAIAVVVSFTGVLMIWEGTSLLHGRLLSYKAMIAVLLVVTAYGICAGRSLVTRPHR